jgi:hypothetical protein
MKRRWKISDQRYARSITARHIQQELLVITDQKREPESKGAEEPRQSQTHAFAIKNLVPGKISSCSLLSSTITPPYRCACGIKTGKEGYGEITMAKKGE